MDKSRLLDQCGALGDDRVLLAKVLDRARQASDRNIPAATDFLSPAQQVQAIDLLHAAGIHRRRSGQSERAAGQHLHCGCKGQQDEIEEKG